MVTLSLLTLVVLAYLGTAVSACVDENTGCGKWAADGECQKNPGYMKESCKKSCGLCDTGKCVDENTGCGKWATDGECQKNPEYMKESCKKSCGICDTGKCVDENTGCGKWATDGECQRNPKYMKESCKKSCGICGTTNVTPKPRPVNNGRYGCSSGIKRYPSSLPNSHYYKRICYTNRGSLKVISANVASAAAIERTAFLIDHVMDKVDPRVPVAMNRAKFRHAVMGAYPRELTTHIPEHTWLGVYWNERARGLGATVALPVGSSAEENAMCYRDDRYLGEDITIHEFAHSLHLTGFALVFPSFDRQLKGLYNSAKRNRIWPGHYAMNDFKEYFAEGVQSYFNANMADRNSPTDRYQLYKRDPNFFSFLDKYLGGNTWSRTCPSSG